MALRLRAKVVVLAVEALAESELHEVTAPLREVGLPFEVATVTSLDLEALRAAIAEREPEFVVVNAELHRFFSSTEHARDFVADIAVPLVVVPPPSGGKTEPLVIDIREDGRLPTPARREGPDGPKD